MLGKLKLQNVYICMTTCRISLPIHIKMPEAFYLNTNKTTVKVQFIHQCSLVILTIHNWAEKNPTLSSLSHLI